MTHYLVKWCSLSYEEATWELQEDLDPEKIKEFEEIQKLPPDLRHTVSGTKTRKKICSLQRDFDIEEKNVVQFCEKSEHHYTHRFTFKETPAISRYWYA